MQLAVSTLAMTGSLQRSSIRPPQSLQPFHSSTSAPGIWPVWPARVAQRLPTRARIAGRHISIIHTNTTQHNTIQHYITRCEWPIARLFKFSNGKSWPPLTLVPTHPIARSFFLSSSGRKRRGIASRGVRSVAGRTDGRPGSGSGIAGGVVVVAVAIMTQEEKEGMLSLILSLPSSLVSFVHLNQPQS